jgi:hypothetical protein
MKIPTVRKSILWAMALALMGGLSLGSPEARGKEPVRKDSAEVTKLLKEARREAVQLQREAETLESYRYGRLTSTTHGYRLDITKDHVNELGKTLDKLEARQSEASAWQQKTIEEMRPVLEGLADRTTRAIEYLNENPSQVRNTDYHDLLTENQELAVRLSDLLDDRLKYGEAKAELEEREADVGLPF